jgi:hypothetical protein
MWFSSWYSFKNYSCGVKQQSLSYNFMLISRWNGHKNNSWRNRFCLAISLMLVTSLHHVYTDQLVIVISYVKFSRSIIWEWALVILRYDIRLLYYNSYTVYDFRLLKFLTQLTNFNHNCSEKWIKTYWADLIFTCNGQ